MVPDVPAVLEIRNLSVRFAGASRNAVENISLTVRPGETLAVVGESGSGKSVTALATMRLTDFDNGKITGGSIRVRQRDGSMLNVNDADQATMRKLRGADVAMIFQEPMTSLNPVMRVGDQLTEAICLHQSKSRHDARAEALRTMELVRIPGARDMLTRYPHELSGGMRQRVMISIALSCRPGLLIADEPTTALDVTIQAQILELMREIQREMDMGILFITHDLGVVAELADRVLVMRQGRMVESAEVASLFARPTQPYTRALLSAIPRLGATKGTDLPMRFDLLEGAETPPSSPVPPLTVPPATVQPVTVQPGLARPEQPVLSARGLQVRFPLRAGLLGRIKSEVRAVENVSFELHAGETLALVGESGSGKTTTGRSLLSLAPRNGGDILLNGQRITDRGAMALLRRKIQFIFQDPYASLDPRMTVGSSLTEPMEVHALASGVQARTRAGDLLERVGLQRDMLDRFPHQFSGGQRQRICIARALAAEPSIIIADESVSALDVSVQAQVINLLLDLQRETGIAMLFISHDMAVVERVSHRVAVMYMGQIVETGTRRQVFENPTHAYTQRLMAAVPIADPTRRRPFAAISGEPMNAVFPVGAASDHEPLHDIGGGHLVARHRIGQFA